MKWGRTSVRNKCILCPVGNVNKDFVYILNYYTCEIWSPSICHWSGLVCSYMNINQSFSLKKLWKTWNLDNRAHFITSRIDARNRVDIIFKSLFLLCFKNLVASESSQSHARLQTGRWISLWPFELQNELGTLCVKLNLTLIENTNRKYRCVAQGRWQ